MKKGLIIAVVAVVAVGGSALAYKAYARYDNWGHGRWHGRMSAGDMTAFADARIAALKAGLALNAEQEKLWSPVEGALRELAGKRIERREQFRAERRDRQGPADPVERLRRGAERLTETGAGLKRLADTTEPLYQSLDEAQKRRFNMLARAGMRGMHQEGRNWRRHGDLGDEGRHMGPRGRGPGGWHERIEMQEAPGAERL
ncbi:MAG: Spy/CpxP family protein refolding chaperone [Xanthobacteraceae bacterium]